MNRLADLDTPCALIDVPRMQHNIERLQKHLNGLGVAFRPHAKTSKCVPVVQAQLAAGARGITVSTLKEAAQFFDAGITDILYAVLHRAGQARGRAGAAAPGLRPEGHHRQRRGCRGDRALRPGARRSLRGVDRGGRGRAPFGHRAAGRCAPGRGPHAARGRHAPGLGVMAHAGSSYDFDTPEALRRIAEQERAGTVRAAERLREAGLPCPVVSVGSTPTAVSATTLPGVTEVRAGVYVFFDLVMHNVGVCATQELALSVLTTVIGHQPEKGWAIVDAGWMAMSRDRGTQRQRRDFRVRAGVQRGRRAAGRVRDGQRQPGARHRLPARRGGMRISRSASRSAHGAHPAQPRLRHGCAAPGLPGRPGRRPGAGLPPARMVTR
jgi:D-serine deaminase-like pyridoxal phosphate-dependent protein